MEHNSINSTASEEFKKDFIVFGLTEEEAAVYLSLLKRGTRGEVVGRIKDELDIGRTTIYAIMERLLSKKWVIAEKMLGEENYFEAINCHNFFVPPDFR